MTRTNRITPGCRVKGSHGDFLPNPRGHNRRIRDVFDGRVSKAIGSNKWEVIFDIDGRIKKCAARSLQVVREDEGLAINEVPATSNTINEEPEDSFVADHEDSDHEENLPNGDWELADEFLDMLNQESESDRHATAYESAWNEIRSLTGEEVVITSDKIRTVWTVVDATDATDDLLQEEQYAGLLDESLSSDTKIAELFLKLWPGDLFAQLEILNLNLVANFGQISIYYLTTRC